MQKEIVPVRINGPGAGWSFPDWQELWRYRYTLNELIKRQIKIRYKQTVLGFLWAIINPLITMIVFTVVFGNLAKVPSYKIPYPIFNFAALVPWMLFSRGLTFTAVSVVSNSNLYTKVYVPRLLAPIATLFAGVVDFLISFVLLLIMMLTFGYLPSIKIVLIPLFTLLALMTVLGFGLWLAAMHVRFRDVGQAVPFLAQVWMYLTPVAYPSSLVQEPWRTVYGLNPMTTVVDGFRWALLDIDALRPSTALLSVVIALAVVITGILYFRHTEGTFADLI
jgi:lipopolysaccharide transport system permease protein